MTLGFCLQTALCSTALDNPRKLSSYDIVTYILEYYPTDTLLFFSEVSTQLFIVIICCFAFIIIHSYKK